MSPALANRVHSSPGRLLIIGLLGLAVSLVGAIYTSKQFFLSYSFSYLFWLGFSIGCLIIAMIHHLTGGRWGQPIRRILEAGFATLPLMALLIIPLLFGLRELYPWANEEELLQHEVLSTRQPYFHTWFFLFRCALYFMVWVLLAWQLRGRSLEQDRTADFSPTRKLRTLSGLGLVIVPITATFAYIDWFMSMEREWYSSLFPVIVLAGQVLAAFCLSAILLKFSRDLAPISSTLSGAVLHKLGNLILTFVMFWGYVAFAQFLIIYSANGPEEISWYLHRTRGGWQSVVWVIAIFHFFIPFCSLLSKRLKRSSSGLATVALLILASHLIYTHWLIIPSVIRDGFHLNWLDLTLFVGIGGIWLAYFFALLHGAPLLHQNHPRIEEELAHA